MNETFDLWKLLAGLGVFLFGMFQLEDSVKALSGKAFRKIISHYTNGRLRSIGSGFLVTSILQVSSAVSLMVLAFVGAGIMSMENAIGVIMGANVGTTATAWIVAFLGFKLNIESFALPLIALGGILMILFGTAARIFHVSRLLMGFGFPFLGLDYMKGSVEILSEGFDLGTRPPRGRPARRHRAGTNFGLSRIPSRTRSGRRRGRVASLRPPSAQCGSPRRRSRRPRRDASSRRTRRGSRTFLPPGDRSSGS